MAKTTSAAASTRKKTRRNVTAGVAHIKATFNNTVITITDTKGETLCWSSAGTCGFKGSRKSTPFAGQMSAQQVAEKAVKFGMKEVDVKVKGPGSGRESAITALQAAGLKIKSIEDVTPLPHNGCRPKNAAAYNPIHDSDSDPLRYGSPTITGLPFVPPRGNEALSQGHAL